MLLATQKINSNHELNCYYYPIQVVLRNEMEGVGKKRLGTGYVTGKIKWERKTKQELSLTK